MKTIMSILKTMLFGAVFVVQSLTACEVVWVFDDINPHHGYREKIGGMPWPKNVDEFQAMISHNNVGLVLTLTDETLPDVLFNGFPGVERMHIPLSSGAKAIPALCAFIERTREVFRRDQAVVVHCEAGVYRTKDALACWCISEKGMNREQANTYLAGCHERFKGEAGMFSLIFERKRAPSLPVCAFSNDDSEAK